MKRQVFLLCFIFIAFVAGCGQNAFEGQEDKNSTQAKQVDISSKLDSGDYAAILNDPDANAMDYAAAAMGAVGIDPVNLIKKINEMSKEGSQNDVSAITQLSINSENLQYLELAGEKLSSIALAAPAIHQAVAKAQASSTDTTLNENYFQRTLVDLVYIITALAQVGENNSSSIVGGFNAKDGISDAEATALGNFITAKATSNDLDSLIVHTKYYSNGNPDSKGDKKLVSAIANKVIEIVSFIIPEDKLGIGITSDIYKTLKEITTGEGSLNYDGDSNNTVTGSDISDYLFCVVGKNSGTIPGTGRMCK